VLKDFDKKLTCFFASVLSLFNVLPSFLRFVIKISLDEKRSSQYFPSYTTFSQNNP